VSAESDGALSFAESAISTWLHDRGYTGATEDECACMLDPSRADEALAMLDHWQVRCGVPAHLIDRAAELIRARAK
jgi:hypothetical protein